MECWLRSGKSDIVYAPSINKISFDTISTAGTAGCRYAAVTSQYPDIILGDTLVVSIWYY